MLDSNPHALAVFKVFDQRVFALEISIWNITREQCSHKLHFVVGLEIGRLISDQRISSRVALVKAVTSKLEDPIPKILGILFCKPQIESPLKELLLIGCDNRFFFLADGFDTRVGFGQLDSAQAIQDPHNLFLVDHHTVGLFEDFLQDRVQVGGGFLFQFDGDVFIDHTPFERAGTIQCVGSDNVAEVVGFHPLEQVSNTATFELKDPFGFASSKQFKGLFILQWELHWIDPQPASLFNHLDSFREDRQVAKA